MIANAAASALVNVVLFAGLPFLFYALHHRRRGRSVAEAAQRAGLRVGEPRLLLVSLALAAAVAGYLVFFTPSLAPFLREGSADRDFIGLGLTGTSVTLALLYGVVKTGFAEELLFRGLIAGSLARRLPPLRANLIQALVFLFPHVLVVVLVMQELWALLPVIFLASLGVGWIRVRSGSIVGPWMIHASANVTMSLVVAARTAE
jgi:membrane protease YdiL (CAAX protease family)